MKLVQLISRELRNGNNALGTEEAGNPVSTLMIDVPRNPPIDVGYTAGLL
jgi:hypothetical protein